jgi:hypothetical protein
VALKSLETALINIEASLWSRCWIIDHLTRKGIIPWFNAAFSTGCVCLRVGLEHFVPCVLCTAWDYCIVTHIICWFYVVYNVHCVKIIQHRPIKGASVKFNINFAIFLHVHISKLRAYLQEDKCNIYPLFHLQDCFYRW